jgi:hypothetical protein
MTRLLSFAFVCARWRAAHTHARREVTTGAR